MISIIIFENYIIVVKYNFALKGRSKLIWETLFIEFTALNLLQILEGKKSSDFVAAATSNRW